MLSLVQANLPLLAVAALIGFATARWTFRRLPPTHDKGDTSAP